MAAGGVASGTVLAAGASQIVSGTAIGTTISAGDVAIVAPGGSAVNPAIAGGTLELAPSGLASGAIAFAAPGGLLRLDGSALTGTPITGFGSGDSIDLSNISASAAS